MEARIDTSFHIDRISGFGIIVPLKAGIIQEFNDQEYHGHLSSKFVGKHINELKEFVEEKLYKTRINNINIYKAYTETGIKNIEFDLFRFNKRLSELDKTHIPEPSKSDYFYTTNSKAVYEGRVKEREMSIKHLREIIEREQAKFDAAKKVIDAVKLDIFKEHGIQY